MMIVAIQALGSLLRALAQKKVCDGVEKALSGRLREVRNESERMGKIKIKID